MRKGKGKVHEYQIVSYLEGNRVHILENYVTCVRIIKDFGNRLDQSYPGINK